MDKNNRRFGIELEFGNEWKEIKEITSKIIKEVYGVRMYYARNESFKSTSRTNKWHIKTDFSASTEITTPISIRENLTKIYKVIAFLRDNGAFVTKDCGFHVHVDISDVDRYLLMAGWLASEKAIFSCFPKTRKNNDYCEKILNSRSAKSYIARILKEKTEMAISNNAISFEYYDERKTMEFRIAEGTTDPEFVRCWVNFILYWVDFIKTQNPCLITCDRCNIFSFDYLIEEMKIQDETIINFMKSRKLLNK